MGKRGKRRRTQRKEAALCDGKGEEGEALIVPLVACTEPKRTVVESETETVTLDDASNSIPAAFDATILQQETKDDRISVLQTCWKRVEARKSKTANAQKLTPTSIQLQSWPIFCHSKLDLIGIAATGSGKTLAYGLGMAVLAPQKGFKGVYGLVLVPTRELAQQVEREIKHAVKHVQVLTIYGGVDRSAQLDALLDNTKHKPKIVTATPGRLVDLWKDCTGQLQNIQMIVLDEADRMASNLDMARQVDQIFNFIDKKPRVCLYSATMPRSVREKWRDWIHKPTAIIKVDTMTVGKDETVEEGVIALAESSAAEHNGDAAEEKEDSKPTKRPRQSIETAQVPAHVTQILHVCSAHKKPKKLLSTIAKIRKDDLGSRQRGLCLVFFSRIKTLQYMNKLLAKEGIVCAELHSQMKQEARERTLNNFRAGKIDTLLASDIAARGIHVNNVLYVINYDFPTSLEQYVHRCGRAGRNQVTGSEQSKMNKASTVYSFFTREMEPMANDVLTLLQDNKAWIDPNLLELAGQSEGGGKRSKRKKVTRETAMENKTSDEHSNDYDDWDDGQFASLNPNRIVLKRASYVSDASDDDEENDGSE